MWNFKKSFTGLKEYAPDRDAWYPIIYLTGAVGSLAYGTYALVDHMRDGRKSNSALNIAKVAAPLMVGSGLAVLGAHCVWRNDDRPSAMMEERLPTGRRGKRSKRAGQARRARASKPEA
ncbi:MAG: hypothetical protein H0W83_14210 [Planctomycetes bacterium]|nr:hypothetical protein [Planctomycetota bacterium]